MHSDLTRLTLLEARELLLSRKISSVNLVQAHLDKIKDLNPQINAFVTVTADHALMKAAESDEKLRAGQAGLLEGIPIAIKDLFCTKGIKTTACSAILQNFIPQYESHVTQNLQRAGGLCIGKTNMDEFAMGSTTTHSFYGSTVNPLQSSKKLVAGGSSGGSAAAVAAGMALGSLGSDTGGSVRQPAAFCGVVGIKPTYGRCSRRGMIAYASSLDQAGIFARSPSDAALLLSAVAGYDPNDATSGYVDTPLFHQDMNKSIKGMRIGIPEEYRIDGCDSEILNSWDKGAKFLEENGAELVRINLKHTKYAAPTYYVIAAAEASSNLARYDGVRYGIRYDREQFKEMVMATRAAFGMEVKRRILMGTYILSAEAYGVYYVKAQKVRRLIYQDFENAFEKVDAILVPTTPTTAFSINDEPQDPVSLYCNDIFTVTASLAGLPAISVPFLQSSDGLPLALQIIGRSYDESTILAIANVLTCGQQKF